MENLILKRIGGLISAHSGISIREQDYKSLADKLWQRAKSLDLKSLEDYYNLLLKELEHGFNIASKPSQEMLALPPKAEWQALYSILTINESYFFRDKNQFQLLTNQLLPEMIQRKQASKLKNEVSQPDYKPSLKIWSAGCSTGEELYSIAMVLEEMKFPWHQWNTLLVGTDISKTAIDAAQRGIYGQWSFRQIPPGIQEKYFHSHHELFQIHDSIRRRVKFVCGNLLKDPFPTSRGDLFDIDLIICRNVFIYLDSNAIGSIVKKFHSTLAPEGFLITGHTELCGQNTNQFQVLSFPESIVYKQRHWSFRSATDQSIAVDLSSRQSSNRPSSLPKRIKASSLRPETRPSRQSLRRTTPPIKEQQDLNTALQEVEHLLQQEAYNKAILSAEKIFSAYPHCDSAIKIAAHAHANIGSYDQAKTLCQQVLKRHPMSIDMYYLLAQIAEEQNELDIAKTHLRKIIYLDSSFVRAYLDLASIYEREKQFEKTKKMQTHALVLLEKLPPDAILDTHMGTTVAEWKKHLASRNV